VKYYFEWGDGTGSWTNFVNSGQSVSKSHSWSNPGTYNVKVKAQDEYGAESGWSTVETVVIINYIPPQQYTLTTQVDPSGSGYITLNPPGGTYDEGTVVTITAVANSGYQFGHWSGDASGSSATIQITMDSNKSITAHFSAIPSPPPQNQPPTVAITSPSDGATLSGAITIHGTASDADGTVQSVQVKIDSGAWIEATGTTSWSYSWNTTTVANGSHTIYARAYDGTDYSSIDSVTVNVNNIPLNHKPTVEIIFPNNGTEVKKTFTIHGTANDEDGSGTIQKVEIKTVEIIFPNNGTEVKKTFTIHGTANDEDGSGTIQKVEIKIGDEDWKVVDGTTSWNYTLDSTTVDNGDYVIQARAYDGQEYSSVDSIMVKVNKEEGGGTPGFEMVALLVAMGIVLWMNRKK